jgi:hypothetical protein
MTLYIEVITDLNEAYQNNREGHACVESGLKTHTI